jgi:lipoyl-dependent peroxiredoxin
MGSRIWIETCERKQVARLAHRRGRAAGVTSVEQVSMPRRGARELRRVRAVVWEIEPRNLIFTLNGAAMATRKAHARWEGCIKEGKGEVDFGNGAFKAAYSFASRFEDGKGTNPEELLGAAHAARVAGIDQAAFTKHAEAAKAGCPVSQALAGTTITLEARLSNT